MFSPRLGLGWCPQLFQPCVDVLRRHDAPLPEGRVEDPAPGSALMPGPRGAEAPPDLLPFGHRPVGPQKAEQRERIGSLPAPPIPLRPVGFGVDLEGPGEGVVRLEEGPDYLHGVGLRGVEARDPAEGVPLVGCRRSLALVETEEEGEGGQGPAGVCPLGRFPLCSGLPPSAGLGGGVLPGGAG